MASDPYLSSFYAGSYHYPGFGVGEGTWSNGGDHMTFLGSYAGEGGVTGVHQAYGADMSGATMFGAAAAAAAGGFGPFAAGPAQAQAAAAGYSFDYHSSAAAAAAQSYSQWGYRTDHPYAGQQPAEQHDGRGLGRVAAAEQAMQGLNISSQAGVVDKEQSSKSEQQENGGAQHQTLQHSKKMSWANIASQPAKPPPPPHSAKTKKPGVLPPPVVVGPGPGKHNLDIGTWDGSIKHNGALPPPPPLLSTGPPGPNLNGNNINMIRPNMMMTQAPPRGVKPPAQLGNMNSNGSVHHGHPPVSPPSHPVLDELKSVNDYNPEDFDMNPKNARFFVLKSYSEDDIHRSIKYEIWCSTEHGNKRLDSAFRERDGRGPVFLFFSVNGSGHFCGMAEMLSCLDYSSSAGVWAQDKWKGKFNVKWIYVKDVPNSQLRHIRLENNENKPVTNSRDTQEVPPEKGKQVLKILHSYKHATSIFDDFIHYEKRQEEDEGRKPPPSSKPSNREKHEGNHFDERGDRGDRGDRRDRRDFRPEDHRDQRDQRRDNRQGEPRHRDHRQDHRHRDKEGSEGRTFHQENGEGRVRESGARESPRDSKRGEERGLGKGRGGASNSSTK